MCQGVELIVVYNKLSVCLSALLLVSVHVLFLSNLNLFELSVLFSTTRGHQYVGRRALSFFLSLSLPFSKPLLLINGTTSRRNNLYSISMSQSL